MNNPLVSIFIPSFNIPDYTRKTLISIEKQSYRPIEVFILDDCSPISLEEMFNEFKYIKSEKFKINFLRNKINLGPDNHSLGFDLSNGKYVVNMPHDDWWIDNDFILETVELMEENPDCLMCAANSIIENTNNKMIILPNEITSPLKWNIMDGDKYITILSEGEIGYQAWSALIFNKEVSKKMGAFHPPFNISKDIGEKLKIIPDEFFAFQFLLSSIGKVAITEKVVSVRGNPITSFVNTKKSEWARSIGLSSFFIHYNLYSSNLQGKYSKAVKNAAFRTLFHHPLKKVSFRIWKYYNFSLKVILLMLLLYIYSLFFSLYTRFKYLKRRLWEKK